MAKKVVLAYSGGLDTSCAIKWLSERDFKVIAFMADLGQGDDFKIAKERAFKAGAVKVCVKDVKSEFVKDFIFPALKANAIYESKYLLATALGRPLIAKYLVEIAKLERAEYISHGCTGKGNDQVRIELSAKILAPELKVIAPLREWRLKSRQEEIDYAKGHRIPIEVTKRSPYSIDRNIWGTSIECGVLENPTVEPPKDAYQMTADPQDAPGRPEYVLIYFEGGIPKKLNERALGPIDLIARLNTIGAKHGVGRSDLIEDRLVGIKSREVYEAPAATILYLAHKDLENLTLDREVLHFKDYIALKYSELIYYGLWFSPLKVALDKFIEGTQQNVTGTVKVKLYKGQAMPVARESTYSLYRKEFATYGEGDLFDQKAAEGFIRIFGMPYVKSKIKNQKSKI